MMKKEPDNKKKITVVEKESGEKQAGQASTVIDEKTEQQKEPDNKQVHLLIRMIQKELDNEQMIKVDKKESGAKEAGQ